MRLRTVLVVSFLLSASLVLAQTFRGGIDGTITDSSGAAVPGVTVTATSSDTGLTRSVQTSDTGEFNFPELPLGMYKVTA